MADEDDTPSIHIAAREMRSVLVGNHITNNFVEIHSGQASSENPPQEEGTFQLSLGIIVYEKDPICPESRIYRAKLLSKITGDPEIAVKLLEFGDRQTREARLHFLVPHNENIVDRICTGTFSYRGQQTIYIAMEKCDDQNMFEYVKSQAASKIPFDNDTYMNYAYQVTNGLAFLHKQNIINRDLKPQNLLLADNKTKVKICDFGISKQITSEADDTVQSMHRPGTDGWRAPEVLNDLKHVTLSCDIFSLGLIFNFLWSYGKHPYGDDPDFWNGNIKRGENRNLDLILITNSIEAKILLAKMLEMEPNKRLKAQEIFTHPIFQTPAAPSKDTNLREIVDNALSKINNLRIHGKVVRNERQTKNISIPVEQVYAVVNEVLAKTRVPWQGNVRHPEHSDSPRDDWEIPRDDITMKRQLNYGGYSEVWKGRWLLKPAAIKVCNEISDSKDRLTNEVEILKRLRHENIIKLYGVVSTPPLMVVLEYLELGSLDNFLRSPQGSKTTIADHLKMALELSRGMVYLEKMRYIHRNLRASYIMLSAKRTCKISTFGRALYLGDKRELKIPFDESFALPWMAPESLTKQRYSIKSDVWCFGILLSEIVTKGRNPSADWTDLEVAEFIQSGKNTPKKANWPLKLYGEVMLRCWSTKPDDRPPFTEIEGLLRSYFDD